MPAHQLVRNMHTGIVHFDYTDPTWWIPIYCHTLQGMLLVLELDSRKYANSFESYWKCSIQKSITKHGIPIWVLTGETKFYTFRIVNTHLLSTLTDAFVTNQFIWQQQLTCKGTYSRTWDYTVVCRSITGLSMTFAIVLDLSYQRIL